MTDQFTIDMINCEEQLIREIANKKLKRKAIAQTYALAIQSSEASSIDWARVNNDIVERWSLNTLSWIKNQAVSGKCFD